MDSRFFADTQAPSLYFTPETRSKSDQFQAVYTILLRQDRDALNKHLEKGLPMSIQEQGHTPISLIAAQGKHGHLNWLYDVLRHYPLTETTLGYAAGGHRESAHSYALTSKDRACEEAEAYGYGLSGDPDNLAIMFKNNAFTDNEKLAYLEGLAHGGHTALMNQVLNMFNHPKAKERALLGLAKGNHTAAIDEWAAHNKLSAKDYQTIVYGLSVESNHISAFKYSAHINHETFIHIVCHGLAYGGHMSKVDMYLDQAKKNSDPAVFERCFWDAIQGYGEGGHFANPSLITRVLCHVADTEMRLKYANIIQTLWAPKIVPDEICLEADCMGALMSHHHLSYEEALPHYHPLVREADGQGLRM